jgi:MarR family
MTPQAMGELVDELEGLGYVQRRRDPTDRRAKLITLTESGRQCVAAGTDTIGDIERRITDALGVRATVSSGQCCSRCWRRAEPSVCDPRVRRAICATRAWPKRSPAVTLSRRSHLVQLDSDQRRDRAAPDD